MVIYLVKNKINGKQYVGQTTTSLKERWYHHCYRCNHTAPRDGVSLLHNALRKYGKDAFDISVLQECENIEELNAAEDEWIRNLKTKSPNGYNLRDGGNNGRLSEITKQKLREVPHTLEWNSKVSEGRKGQKANANQLRGLARGWELFKLCPPNVKGEKNGRAIVTEEDVSKIRNLYASRKYSQKEIASMFKIGQTTVSDIVLRKKWTHV
jgi:group I intron endonuclease